MLHVVVGEEKQQKYLRPPMQQDNCMEPWTWSSQHQSPRLMNVVKQLGYFFSHSLSQVYSEVRCIH